MTKQRKGNQDNTKPTINLSSESTERASAPVKEDKFYRSLDLVVRPMKTFDEIKNILKEHKEMLKEKYKVKEIAIFGSYARDEQDDKSDIDIMVEFEEPVGFEFIHLADFLEELLGAKVDLTTKDSIKPNRWKYIQQDLIYV